MEKLKRVEKYITAYEVYGTRLASGSVVKIRLMNMLDDIGIKDNQQITISTLDDGSKKITIDWLE